MMAAAAEGCQRAPHASGLKGELCPSIQRKGSKDQADATLRAAVTTVRLQYAGALE
jgi:hypothetical protein